MGHYHYKITHDPVSGEAIVNTLIKPKVGAVVTFVGVVRGATQGRGVQYLEYEAYPEMAEKILTQIGDEVRQRWSEVEDIAIVHRIGHLDIGDTAVVIAISAAHRRQLFDALHYTIDRVKIIAPIWKKEVWSDGTGEWKSEL
jgi:molybdopterin synthase catalytic subunit